MTLNDLSLAFSRRGRRHQGAPRELRQQTADVVRGELAMGRTLDDVARELGIPYGTLSRWMRHAGLDVRAARRAAKAEFVGVEVKAIEAAPPKHGVRVTHASGLVVDGLNLDDLIALLRALQ